MKNNALVFAFLLFAISIFYSCSQKNSETNNTDEHTGIGKLDALNTLDSGTSQTTTKPEGNFVDPNQPSELAALMREMFTDAEKMQVAIKANKIPTDLRAKFAKMQNAKPTEAEMTEAPFGEMAKVFLQNMDKVYEEKNQVQDYNIMVQSCLACHQNQCPGPMVRIKKLLIL